LFHGEDLSPPAIAERFDVAASTVRKWVQRFDIREEPARRAPPSAETLHRLHHEEHLSLPEISDELGRSTPSVEWWMGKHNIEIVNRQGYRYTHDELLDELREYSRDGIDETKRHLSETDAAPDPDRFARRFGSFAAAWYRAGFEIPPQDDDAGLTNDQSRTLQTERTAAKTLPAPDEVVARCELDISTSAFRRFTENRILVKAFRERVLETADGTTRWRWRVAPGVHEWVKTNLTNTTECPADDCHATGIHNPRDVDGYQCTNEACDETFGREVAEEVMGG
jgi:transposase